MKARFLAPLCFLAAVQFSLYAKAQVSSCPNSGFDNGDFAGWTGGVGYCCPISISNTTIVSGRHTVMSGTGTDPNTDGAIPVVAPGAGPFSARLGNSYTDSQAERLSYSLTVDASNALFVYRYAVVLEDPDHTASEQPRFEIRMFDQSGAPIDCGMYNVYSTAGIPGFVTITNQYGSIVNYKNWTTVGMDLTAYMGQTVTIEFATGDCSLGAHYGYAYIDCYCSPLAISSDFCPNSDSTTLAAPVGFASYQWFDALDNTLGTSSSITVIAPVEGDQYSCVLTSVTGCTATISTTLTPSIVASGYGQVGNCMNAVQFHDNSTVTSGPPITSWHWDFGDGDTSNLPDPFHSYGTPGDHEVQLTVESSAGCPSTFTQTITLIPAPITAIGHNAPCLGEPLELHDITTSGVPVIGRVWDFGDGSPTETGTDPVHGYAAVGDYDITLIVTAANGCEDTLVVPITVSPTPAVDIGPDQGLCEGEPVSFNAGNAGMQFLWNTGAQTQSLAPTVSGTYSVEVTSAVGCTGRDTVLLDFDPPPVIALHDTVLCAANTLMLDAGNPGCTYLWSTGETMQAISLEQVSGTHAISVTVTSAAGCARTSQALATFIPEVAVELGPDQVLCDGETALLNAGAVPNATYTWSSGGTGQTEPVTNTGTVHVLVQNSHCQASDSVHLLFNPLPLAVLNDTTICVEHALTLDAGNPGCTYQWSTGATTRSITLNDASGSYAVTVATPQGCVRTSTVQAVFMPSIVLDLGPDSVLCEGDLLTLDAGGPGPFYQWSTGSTERTVDVVANATVSVRVSNGYCVAHDTIALSFIPYPHHAEMLLLDTCFEDPRTVVTLHGSPLGTLYSWSTGDTTRNIQVRHYGNYMVAATNPPRCTTVDTILIREFCQPRVFVPNTFTPNNDGANDFFAPVKYNVIDVELAIFDRWGEIVFLGTGEQAAWDGSVGGQAAPIGVYTWRYIYDPLLVDGGLANRETIYGHVTLLR